MCIEDNLLIYVGEWTVCSKVEIIYRNTDKMVRKLLLKFPFGHSK